MHFFENFGDTISRELDSKTLNALLHHPYIPAVECSAKNRALKDFCRRGLPTVCAADVAWPRRGQRRCRWLITVGSVVSELSRPSRSSAEAC